MNPKKSSYSILLGQLLAVLFIFFTATPARSVTIDLTGTPVSAINDSPCVGTHANDNLGCTAKEFTVNPVFSAAPDTPPMCVAGNNFDFLVDLQLSGSNAKRYDITFYTGQVENAPDVNDSSKLCSATAFPMSLASPWDDLDSSLNACSDYTSAGDSIVRINRIKVKCASDALGYLTVPYTLAYEPNTGSASCNPSDPSTYPQPIKSKCQTGASSVSGTIKVFSGAYLDVTKQTLPDGDPQAFTFSAAGPGGSSIIALTGSTTLGLAMPTDGTYNPTTAAAATNSLGGITLTDGQTARFYINAITASQTLTITEATTTNWESTASISCSAVTGSPTLTTNNANRTMSASLNTTNSAAACTITNTKRSRITLAKSVGVRVDTNDQFTVSASGGGALTGTTSTTTSGSGTSASTTFYSSPNTALTLADAKSAGPTALSGYISNLTCTNAFTGSGATPNSSLPNGLLTTSTSITPAPGDDITCTYTNTKKVDFTLKKTWVNAIVTDAVNVTATGLTTLASTANTASETDTGGVQAVRVGDVITIGETFTSGTAANYNAVLSCTGNATALSGSVLTVNSADTAITCTQTNTRKTATLTLQKTWVNAILTNAVDVTATGLTTLASVAGSANETDAGAAQTVRAGDAITIAESFTSGTAAGYNSVLSCSGNATALSGNLLTVNSADAAITCTQTNTKKPATITVNKILTPAASADKFNLLVGATTVAAAAGNGGSGIATVLSDTAVTVSEIAAGAADLANYNTTYSCTGGITGSGVSVSITPSPDAAVICTFTNALKMPLLSILKSANTATANPGQVIIYTVQIVNSPGAGPGASVVLTDDLSPYGAFRINSYAAPPFSFFFTDSSPASGLSLGIPEYSYNNGSAWFSTPLTDTGGGADGNVTNWRIPMTGTIRPGGSFILNYQVIVK